MKRRFLSAAMIAAALGTVSMPLSVFASDGVPMYRMYNYHSGEHFYTASVNERDYLLVAGWDYEGRGWTAPKEGAPVYRLYNPNAGDHHYTKSEGEKNALMRLGWNYEGIGWKSGGTVPLYREYNPNAETGAHNYTASKAENDALVRLGWKDEGIGWFGTFNPEKGSTNIPDGFYFVELSTGEHTDTEGYIKDLKIQDNDMTFTGRMYRSGTERAEAYKTGEYSLAFAEDCLFYYQPTDIAPREIITETDFFHDVTDSWQSSGGLNSLYMMVNIQNGYVTYSYLTA